ncbi:MAG: SUMF1/EgtB/PvdO family nonheme iron enzyme [Candidatus Krumholzibacteriota bacterium]|nr:SUMF1/EgtB/PvdO family nonheme iron enzyme [Candidatus Krumholzibacteriota bacterium]
MTLRTRQIFDFYWPLMLTSQMMTLAAPIINLGLGRSAQPAVQLAAYAVGFGLLVLLNSPLFPLVQTVAVMATGPASRRDLWRRGLTMGSAICAFELLLALSPGGDELIARLMGSTPAVSDLAQKVILVQSPIPLLLPIRSFYYALFMRHRNTRIITQSTATRLALLSAIIFGALGFGHLPGAVLGASSLTLGILTETLYVSWRGRRLLRHRAPGIDELHLDGPVSWRALAGFITPLMISTITWSAMRPVVNAVIGRGADPDLAQAGFGFVFPLLVLFASPLWSFQGTAVVLVKEKGDLPVLFRFGAATMAIFAAAIACFAWTPLRSLIVHGAYSLTPELASYVVPGLMLIPLHPFVLGTRSITQGFLMGQRRTRVIGWASVLRLALVAAVGFHVIRAFPGVNGAFLGTLLLIAGDSAETAIELAALGRVWRRMAPALAPARSAATLLLVLLVPLLSCSRATEDMVPLPGGSFKMGDSFTEGGLTERPVHEVQLSPFLLARHEVTVDQFRAFMEDTGGLTTAETARAAGGAADSAPCWFRPGFPQTGGHPVVCVSWHDAVAYCNWRSRREGRRPCYREKNGRVLCDFTAGGYRLPTEAEWEFAASAGGQRRRHPWGDGPPVVGGAPAANLADSSAQRVGAAPAHWFGYDDGAAWTASVGSYAANALGIHGLGGNVREWCWDLLDGSGYESGPAVDPTGAPKGPWRACRGGSWAGPPDEARVAARGGLPPDSTSLRVGFRLARSVR